MQLTLHTFGINNEIEYCIGCMQCGTYGPFGVSKEECTIKWNQTFDEVLIQDRRMLFADKKALENENDSLKNKLVQMGNDTLVYRVCLIAIAFIVGCVIGVYL